MGEGPYETKKECTDAIRERFQMMGLDTEQLTKEQFEKQFNEGIPISDDEWSSIKNFSYEGMCTEDQDGNWRPMCTLTHAPGFVESDDGRYCHFAKCPEGFVNDPNDPFKCIAKDYKADVSGVRATCQQGWDEFIFVPDYSLGNYTQSLVEENRDENGRVTKEFSCFRPCENDQVAEGGSCVDRNDARLGVYSKIPRYCALSVALQKCGVLVNKRGRTVLEEYVEGKFSGPEINQNDPLVKEAKNKVLTSLRGKKAQFEPTFEDAANTSIPCTLIENPDRIDLAHEACSVFSDRWSDKERERLKDDPEYVIPAMACTALFDKSFRGLKHSDPSKARTFDFGTDIRRKVIEYQTNEPGFFARVMNLINFARRSSTKVKKKNEEMGGRTGSILDLLFFSILGNKHKKSALKEFIDSLRHRDEKVKIDLDNPEEYALKKPVYQPGFVRIGKAFLNLVKSTIFFMASLALNIVFLFGLWYIATLTILPLTLWALRFAESVGPRPRIPLKACYVYFKYLRVSVFYSILKWIIYKRGFKRSGLCNSAENIGSDTCKKADEYVQKVEISQNALAKLSTTYRDKENNARKEIAVHISKMAGVVAQGAPK